jgi:hypothetical protein
MTLALTSPASRGHLYRQSTTNGAMPGTTDLQQPFRHIECWKISGRARLHSRSAWHPPMRALAVAMVLLAAGTGTLRAEVRIEGDAAALRIEAKNSRITDVLAALGKTMNVQLRTSSPLNRTISGTYQGSLQKILPKLLKGYDYIIKTHGAAVEVLVYGSQASRAVGAAPMRRFSSEKFPPQNQSRPRVPPPIRKP